VFCPASAFVSADKDEARNPQHFIHVAVSGKHFKDSKKLKTLQYGKEKKEKNNH
jgi:hypothetical protein